MVPFLKKQTIRKRDEILSKIKQLQDKWNALNEKGEDAPLKRDILSKIDGSLTALRWVLKEIEDI